MDWLNQLNDIVGKYGNTAHPTVPDSVDADFDKFARHAPAETVAEGLAEAFRSPHTPAFGSMLSQLFPQSSSTQKMNVINTLIATLGPALVSQLLARHGAADAAEAEKRDPSIVERISKFYADQPQLLKTLGGLALTVALAKVAQEQTRR